MSELYLTLETLKKYGEVTRLLEELFSKRKERLNKLFINRVYHVDFDDFLSCHSKHLDLTKDDTQKINLFFTGEDDDRKVEVSLPAWVVLGTEEEFEVRYQAFKKVLDAYDHVESQNSKLFQAHNALLTLKKEGVLAVDPELLDLIASKMKHQKEMRPL